MLNLRGLIAEAAAWLVLLPGALVVSALGAQTKADPKNPQPAARAGNRIFETELRPAAAALLAEVEKKFGTPVREIYVQPSQNASAEPLLVAGESGVEPGGTPFIRIYGTAGRTEETIVHELYHLKLIADGFSPPPAFKYQGSEMNAPFVQMVWAFIYDPLQHWLFFPEMRAMRLDPDEMHRATVRQAIRADEFDGLRGRPPKDVERLLAMYYFEFSMHFDDDKLAAEMTSWYERKGWHKALTTGKRLVKFVNEAKPRTPAAQIEAFVNCLNVLYQGEARLELDGWEKSRSGTYQGQRAIIRVLPPN